MTTEELIQAFPECEKIKREDIAECITKAMTEERFYAEASDKVYNKAYELWPYQRGLKDDDPERVAYEAYFWGDILKGVEAPFKKWQETFKTEFIAQHGQVRTFDEACQTAADEWARMIFGNHIQNNGDQSDAGGLAMVLGTLKNRTAQKARWQNIKRMRTLKQRLAVAITIGDEQEQADVRRAIEHSEYQHRRYSVRAAGIGGLQEHVRLSAGIAKDEKINYESDNV